MSSTPTLDKLRSEYLENRVQELAALAEALQRADFPVLNRAGHNLKGTGAAYGFDQLTEIGKALESAAKEQDARMVEVLLGRTESYLRQVRASATHP
jgi:HPt (histidine-containing phosphotransfer) domain-containing protein